MSHTALLLQFKDPPQKVSQVGIVFPVGGDGEIPQSHRFRPGVDYHRWNSFDGDIVHVVKYREDCGQSDLSAWEANTFLFRR